MANTTHRPKKGSMGFGPRTRANRPYGRVKSWPHSDEDEVRVQGFAGWKAVMTHVLMRDLNPGSPSAGAEVRKAVTVVEVPPMRVLAVRGYRMTPYGKQTAGEGWADAEKSLYALLNAGVNVREAWESAASASGSPWLATSVRAWLP